MLHLVALAAALSSNPLPIVDDETYELRVYVDGMS